MFISVKKCVFLVAIWTIICFANANHFSDIQFDISKELEDEFLKALEISKNGQPQFRFDDQGRIVANVSNFADKIFKNIAIFAVNHGLDPMAIGGFDEGFLTAHITLQNGSLNGISTVSRNGDVNVRYSPSTKQADLVIPLMFDDIGFSYQYHVIILLVGPRGQMIGHIKKCKVEVALSFDFYTYIASVEKLKMTDSGHASITFIGGVLEIVVDLLSEFLSVVLHPFIIAIVQGVVKSVANLICNGVNEFINGTFVSPQEAHHNTTQFIL